MRILVGVQGTGNGHLSRCAALAEALAKQPDISVDYLVSGRTKEQFFDMDVFGQWQWRQGLTFAVERGKVQGFETLRRNDWQQFWQDVRKLDLSSYDLVVSDYEPITAWAGRFQRKRVIGLGRQYAFYQPTPSLPITAMQRQLIRWFAPADEVVGMHWFDDGSHLLPPIIHQRAVAETIEPDRYLVYLPFESLTEIHRLLLHFPQLRFDVYHPQAECQQIGHIRYSSPTRIGFAQSLASAVGVISNAGFETASEALALGKKLLVKPLAGQFEQLANARCLAHYGFAQQMDTLDAKTVSRWLAMASGVPQPWPDVATAVANWLKNGATMPVRQLSSQLWQRMEEDNYRDYLRCY
ncbi:conserved hypothetical protein [Pseudidiomarina indica]|uniref:Glycosyltransferase n=1 Tax=Pseudidiomarina indica TaxID=1159017 RepID=A0A1G6C9R2_9GAMM|nr:MJ1255/VC2487 family glycosyltransferase [Pseudidiomarina indica]SDB29625.1 conserved hypothetical protein [Pseudidiomarina indica]